MKPLNAICSLCVLLLASLSIREAAAAADSRHGAQVFRACAACHSVASGEHLTGPSLANVVGRKAGEATGFLRYSDALMKSNVTWSEDNLDKWLANPNAFIAGTSMTFAGVRSGKDREDVIAYLKSASVGGAPGAASGGMMMQSRKPNLKKAPPQGQVTSISHCGDTYTVKTADGKVEKVWEFNLRFKTDSSDLGPPPGRPAVLGAGMQGDRASVVFSAPEEISRFIRESCE